MSKLKTLQDVVDKHLCMGCGACAAHRPEIVKMVDTVDHGRRPLIASDASHEVKKELIDICPGRAIAALPPAPSAPKNYSHVAWGPVLEVWEGFAVDPQLRFNGSSGGAVSALAMFCIEELEFAGAVQVRSRADQPLLNETVISRNKSDVLAATASRYAPASPCERLADVRDSGEPHVFIGKPCDVTGAAKLCSKDENLSSNLGLTISILCAGTPSLAATQELMSHLGVKEGDEVSAVRYRGQGWPGRMAVEYTCGETGERREVSTSYEEGWGEVLQKHTQWRCRVCADHVGEYADLSVGDPWYRPITDGDHGQSLIVVRTERGREAIRKAMLAGVVSLEPRDLATLANSQPNLERTKGAVFARCITTRLTGGHPPSYSGAALHRVWWKKLSLTEKLKSFLGTAKRIYSKKLFRSEQAKIYGRARC